MSTQGLSDILQGVELSSFNPKHALAWLEEQPADEQASLANDVFQALLQSAAQPKQSSGNACVKLCGLVELCSRSPSPCLKEFAFKESTAVTMFNFFIEWNEQDAHRSMRLVLDFLVRAATHNPSPETGATIRTRLLAETISMITEKSSRPSIKSALTALDHMILKKLIYLDDVLSAYVESRKSERATWETIVYQIFEWMVLHYVCPAAGKLVVTILTSPWYRDRDERHQPGTWHNLIYPALESNAELLEPIRLYVLIPLFKADRAGALEYLQQLTSLQGLTGDRGGEGWNLNAMLWLSMLEAGKKIGVVDEPGQGLKQKPGAVTQLDTHILDEVLCHESHEARSSAVAILIASPSTTRPYTPEVLDLLRKHLPSFHSDASSKFRYEVLGHTRNMIKRIHGALESVRREYEKAVKKAGANNAPATSVEQLEQTLRKHRAFVSWYLEFLKTEMSPTASYQRHITALKAMNFVLGSPLIQESEVVIFQDASRCALDLDWLRCVLDLVMDPFDDVRDAAAGLVMRLSTDTPDEQSSPGMHHLKESMATELEELCKRADELASKTARADHSDGLARSYQLLHVWKSNLGDNWLVPRKLLDDLEKKLSSADGDLAAAVLDAPVHGDFAALRYLWTSLGSISNEADAQTMSEVRNRAIQCCEKIWQLVQHILCDDSPEGHLPEELEEVDGLDTKDLLSYSFRAIHESSNLLRVIASDMAAMAKKSLYASNRSSFETIGRLTFIELSTLRHRGAFTTVSHTFSTCCQLVKHFPNDDSSSDLLNEWYQGALQCIHTQRSTTRRSAGIPALIVGVLSANEEKPSFHDVIQELQEISRRPALVAETDGSNLSQVHAMNSLKDIFKSSYLSKRAEPYLTQCLQLAADCLKSEVWAIRNCGLLLLRSLIDCLLGTNESKTSMEAGWDGKTTRISYHKFPELPMVLVNLLKMGQIADGVLIGSQSAESVFPALDIIRRAGPPEAARDVLYELISWYLGSRIWHVREIAARTLCSFLLKSGWIGDIQELFALATSTNQLHGSFLTLKFLLERLSEVMPEQISSQSLETLSRSLLEIAIGSENFKSCTEVQAAYIEVANLVKRLEQRAASTEKISAQIDVPQPVPSNWLSDRTSALLPIQIGVAQVQRTTRLAEAGVPDDTLDQALSKALSTDVNVSCQMLESLSILPDPLSGPTISMLINVNTRACLESKALETLSIALTNLSVLVDRVLHKATISNASVLNMLPKTEDLIQLWGKVTRSSITPSLSESAMSLGGSMLAVAITRSEEQYKKDLPLWLRTWGAMMATAGLAEQSFDARRAAAEAMSSLSLVLHLTRKTSIDQAHLPWLMALYDSLNDDDDEVREVADKAAGHLLGKSLAPIEAGAQLLAWLCISFGQTDEFKAQMASRLAGHEFSTSVGSSSAADASSWSSAEDQLGVAMQFDDALFVVEEQNLYIDEVREAERWQAAFVTCFGSGLGDDGTTTSDNQTKEIVESLSSWAASSMQTLGRITEREGRDGPLGWTSKPAVFAICCRILVTSVSLVDAMVSKAQALEGTENSNKIKQGLASFVELGKKNQVHGLLLGICKGAVEGQLP